MSAPDTISQAVNSIASMNEMEYVYLLFKLGGIAVGAIISGGGAIATLYAGATWAWRRLLKSIKSSLAGTFCSPQDMEECRVEQESQLKAAIEELRNLVINGFENGRHRMDQLDSSMRSLSDNQKHTTTRVDKLFVALANDAIPSDPPPDVEVPPPSLREPYFHPFEGSLPDGT